MKNNKERKDRDGGGGGSRIFILTAERVDHESNR